MHLPRSDHFGALPALYLAETVNNTEHGEAIKERVRDRKRNMICLLLGRYGLISLGIGRDGERKRGGNDGMVWCHHPMEKKSGARDQKVFAVAL